MNYAAHYQRLIDRARGRSLDGYHERHHVIPKCMGGGNESENLVELTAREHWFAHKLLIFIYPGNWKLVYAATYMAKRASNGRVYEWLRKRHALALSALHRGKKLSAQHIERLRSPEARAKQAAASRGKQYAKGSKRPDLAALNVSRRGLKSHGVAESNKRRKGESRSPRSVEHSEGISAGLLAYYSGRREAQQRKSKHNNQRGGESRSV